MKGLSKKFSVLGMGLLLGMGSAWADTDSAISADEQVRLKRFLVQDCGSCHGLQMKGGLGPALTPERLASMPKSSLIATVLYGRPGTAMPPWQDFLSEDQAQWLIEELLKGL